MKTRNPQRSVAFTAASPAVALGALLALAGCSSEAGTGYQGEALATLHGTVQLTDTSAPPPPLEAALVWLRDEEQNPDGSLTPLNTTQVVASSASVSSTFPNDFTLQVFTPPPASVLIACVGGDAGTAGPHWAYAEIKAVAQSTDPNNVVGADIYGVASDYTVLYVDSDVTQCGSASAFTPDGNPAPVVTKGYHLLRTTSNDGYPDPFGASLAPDGFATPITLQIQAQPLDTVDNRCTAAKEYVTEYLGPNGEPEGTVILASYPPTTGCPAPWRPADSSDTMAMDEADQTQDGGLYDGGYGAVCQLDLVAPSEWVGGSCEGSTPGGFCYVPDPANSGCSKLVFSSTVTLPPSAGFFTSASTSDAGEADGGSSDDVPDATAPDAGH